MHAEAKDNNKQRKNIGILTSEMSGICEPQVQRFYFLQNNNLLGGLQSFKQAKNPTSTRKQNKKTKITKERSMKSENNKKNYMNCQNQGPGERFSKSKDLTVQVVIS